MTSPLPQETITLNATKLKKTIIKVLLNSTKHHYYLTAAKKNFTTLRKYDETELTIIYHNYMAITAECIKDVGKFVQKLHGKFGHKDGSFYANEVVIEIFLHDLEHF